MSHVTILCRSNKVPLVGITYLGSFEGKLSGEWKVKFEFPSDDFTQPKNCTTTFSCTSCQHSSRTITMASSLPEPRPVSEPPKDGITALSYITKNLLASTSWDGSVRLHDTIDLQCKLSHFLAAGPLLSLATPTDTEANNIVAGGMDGSSKLPFLY